MYGEHACITFAFDNELHCRNQQGPYETLSLSHHNHFQNHSLVKLKHHWRKACKVSNRSDRHNQAHSQNVEVAFGIWLESVPLLSTAQNTHTIPQTPFRLRSRVSTAHAKQRSMVQRVWFSVLRLRRTTTGAGAGAGCSQCNNRNDTTVQLAAI